MRKFQFFKDVNVSMKLIYFKLCIMNFLKRNWHPVSIALSSLTSYTYICYNDTIPKVRYPQEWCKKNSHVYPYIQSNTPSYGINIIYGLLYGTLFGAVGIPLTLAMYSNSKKLTKTDGKCECKEAQ